MIFVTLGTQKFQFDRILKELDRLIDQKKLKSEEIMVQNVCQEYQPKNFKCFRLKPQEEIDKITKNAEIIITHSGTGSIINSLKMGKRIIIVPRQKKFGEHVDNHQLEMAEVFHEKYNIPIVTEMDTLYDVIQNINEYRPIKWEENNKKLINSIENKINELL